MSYPFPDKLATMKTLGVQSASFPANLTIGMLISVINTGSGAF
jgi:hypothetical protein